jgi:hypothetical protein
VILALFCSAGAVAQTETSPPFQIYGGYSWLSNSFNGVPGSRQPLNDWNAGAAFPQWHHLRFKIDYSMYPKPTSATRSTPSLPSAAGSTRRPFTASASTCRSSSAKAA